MLIVIVIIVVVVVVFEVGVVVVIVGVAVVVVVARQFWVPVGNAERSEFCAARRQNKNSEEFGKTHRSHATQWIRAMIGDTRPSGYVPNTTQRIHAKPWTEICDPKQRIRDPMDTRPNGAKQWTEIRDPMDAR